MNSPPISKHQTYSRQANIELDGQGSVSTESGALKNHQESTSDPTLLAGGFTHSTAEQGLITLRQLSQNTPIEQHRNQFDDAIHTSMTTAANDAPLPPAAAAGAPQPSQPRNEPARSCKDTRAGAYVQGGVSASAHVVAVGVSGTVTLAGSTSGQACVVRTACVRVGPGLYGGAGGTVGAGGVRGSADALGGWSVGVGADAGTGVSTGGQVTVGINSDGSTSSAGASKGKGGAGAGVSVGVDVCYSWTNCTPCE
jgi:hypothetical protein